MYGPLFIAALLAPFGALLAVGFVWPLGSAVGNSLTGTGKFGESYAALTADAVFWVTLAHTLETALLVAVICLLVAYPTAEFLNRGSPSVRPILLALVIIPLWSSTIARTYSWYGVFVRNGVLDSLAAAFGKGPLQLLYSQPAVIVGMVHVLLPILILPLYAAVRNYDERLSLASLSLGAGRLRTLLLVKLPVLLPQLVAGTSAVFILALGFFITPAVLGGPRSQMISNLISQQVFQVFDLARADAMSVALVATVLLFLGIVGGTLQLLRRYFR
jgi:ABC-type spermidine/putrescine transport system permease subunit I